MADVFISYKREERDAVTLLAEKLRALQLDVWFDGKLRTGGAFDDEIAREIEAAKAVLTCWTPAAIASEWVRAEAAMARDAEKFVPCFLEPTKLVPPFNLVQTEDLMSWAGQENDPAWLKVLARIGELVGRPGLALYHGVMRPDASALELRAWATANGADPLAETVWARVARLEGETADQRIAREQAEARERDHDRQVAAAKSRELARARGVRDPAAAQRRITRLTVAVVMMAVVALGGLGYTMDSRRRQSELERVQTPSAAAAFIRANRWHPVARMAREKLRALDRSAWATAQAQGTIAAYDEYLAQFPAPLTGAFTAQARAARERGVEVQKAQEMLARLWVYRGPLHGGLDEATRQAINVFLYRQGTVQTGRVDEDLFRRLAVALEAWTKVAPSELVAQRLGPPTAEEYRGIAERLGIDGPTLMAIKELEVGSRSGFYGDGHPVVVFERHLFSRFTGGRFDEGHPNVSARTPGGPGPSGEQWARLSDAHALDADAAYRATSFGLFQILGMHHRRVGFETVAEFARFVSQSEANQVEVWARFVDQRIRAHLQRHDWAAFARAYVGGGSVAARYEQMLAAAYTRAVAEFNRP
jgi:N-acetylmuramidase/TIR domain